MGHERGDRGNPPAGQIGRHSAYASRNEGERSRQPGILLRGNHPPQEVNGKESGQEPQHDAWHVEDRFALAHERVALQRARG